MVRGNAGSVEERGKFYLLFIMVKDTNGNIDGGAKEDILLMVHVEVKSRGGVTMALAIIEDGKIADAASQLLSMTILGF